MVRRGVSMIFTLLALALLISLGGFFALYLLVGREPSVPSEAFLEMRVGGGTSIMPRIAPTLREFVTADDGEYLKVAEAVFRVYDRQDWLRPNRARARIKVFVDKYGIEELARQVDEELEGDWVAERDFSLPRDAWRANGRACRCWC